MKSDRFSQLTSSAGTKGKKRKHPSTSLPASAVKQFKTSLKLKDSSHSLYEFFSQENSKKRRKVDGILNETKQREEKASTVIPYRDDGRGKGAYHDHYTTQLLTQYPTAVASTGDKPTFHFTEYLRTVTHDLSFGSLNEYSRHIPPSIEEVQNKYGLLLIPGAARVAIEGSASEYKPRSDNEAALINKARNLGQPILAICAGSWTVWQRFGGKLRDVHHHNCRAGMPRIKDSTGKVGHNIQVHRINIDLSAHLLKAASSFTEAETPTVNSVHWKAVDEKSTPTELVVSARALYDEKVAPDKMKPETGSVEAFESKHGAPVLGIQWHPEAYTNNSSADYKPTKHQNLIKYMVKAGQAFKDRRMMIKEVEQKCIGKTSALIRNSLLKQTNLIKSKNDVIRTESNGVVKFAKFFLRPSKYLRHVSEIEREIEMKEAYLLEKGYRKTR